MVGVLLVVILVVDTKAVEAVVLILLVDQVAVVVLVQVLDLQFMLQVVWAFNFQRHSVILRVLSVVLDQHLQQSLVLIPQVSTGFVVVVEEEVLIAILNHILVWVVDLLHMVHLGQVVVKVHGIITVQLLQLVS